MKKIAFLVPDLGPSELAFHLITQINSFAEKNVGYDFCVFYESLQRPCLTMNFASMPIAEGWGFDGPIIATSFTTAQKSIGFPSSPNKIFYVWDLEWQWMKKKEFRDLQAVYGHPEITLWSRGEDHSRVLSQCWHKPALVIPNFDIPTILKVMDEELAI